MAPRPLSNSHPVPHRGAKPRGGLCGSSLATKTCPCKSPPVQCREQNPHTDRSSGAEGPARHTQPQKLVLPSSSSRSGAARMPLAHPIVFRWGCPPGAVWVPSGRCLGALPAPLGRLSSSARAPLPTQNGTGVPHLSVASRVGRNLRRLGRSRPKGVHAWPTSANAGQTRPDLAEVSPE